MKRTSIAIFAAALLLGSGAALAHGRVFFGFNFGVPVYGGWYHPWYYGPPPVYYYPAPVVVQPPEPPVYVQRSDAAPEGSASWYYCRQSNGYYPYVKECPSGWERVPAQPAK